jgi:chemotaxis protein CheX
MTTAQAMKVEYINPFLTATVDAFDTMLNCKLTRGKPYLQNGAQPEHEVSGIIGLTGKAKGMVVLSMSRSAALGSTAALLGERPCDINAEVSDAIGELANIVAGSAKAKLVDLDLSVSLPTVVIGKNHILQFPTKVTPICIPFTSGLGLITVQVGLES